ncbi:PTEN family protein [Megaselia abdita]
MKGNSSKLTYKFCFKLKMANKLSVMANPIRNIISGNRNRLKDGTHDLDLVYIQKNIIAMGYPAANMEAIYRNNIEDVVNFFNENHRDHFKIYNLCCEKKYDASKFNNKVACYPFVDHCPPTIELILGFCEDVHKFLVEDRENVVAIHCKAGKGRTGTMISCYLIYSKMVKDDKDALEFYGLKRTTDGKGVTIPSQRRYVNYFSQLRNENLQYRTKSLQICEIQLSSAPLKTSSVSCQIFTLQNPVDPVEVTKCETIILDCSKNLRIEKNLIVSGDVKIELKNLFHFWFNTFFVTRNAEREGEGDNMRYKYVLNKNELDGAHKDKSNHFAKDFKVTVYLKPCEDYNNHNNSAYKSQNNQIITNNYGNNRISAPIIQNNSNSNHQTQVKQQMQMQRKSIPMDRRNNEGQLFFYPPQTHPSQQQQQQQQNHNTSSSSYNNYNYFMENNSTTVTTGMNNISRGGSATVVPPLTDTLPPVENSNSCSSVSNQSASNNSTTSSTSSSSSSSVDANGEDWESEINNHHDQPIEGKEQSEKQLKTILTASPTASSSSSSVSITSSSCSSPPFASERFDRNTLLRKPSDNDAPLHFQQSAEATTCR